MDVTFREGFISAYRMLLRAMGTSAPHAVPDLGDELTKRFAALENELEESVSETLLQSASQQAAAELSDWAERANIRHSANSREIKEILAGITSMAEALEKRDQSCGREITGLAQRLRCAAENDDINLIRRSILESTEALTVFAEKMVEEGAASLARLSAEVDRYRTRLETSEALSWKDPLTGLCNRRSFDSQLDKAIKAGTPFSLVLVDLNGFKAVNDQYGHLVGDELLKQFGGELRSQFSGANAVARWGGDEFAVILNSTLRDTEVRVQRLQRWAVGDYVVKSARETVKVCLDASFGAVEWRPSESARNLLNRADRELYEAKQLVKAGEPV